MIGMLNACSYTLHVFLLSEDEWRSLVSQRPFAVLFLRFHLLLQLSDLSFLNINAAMNASCL